MIKEEVARFADLQLENKQTYLQDRQEKEQLARLAKEQPTNVATSQKKPP